MSHLRNSLINKTPVRTHVEKDLLELKLSWKFCRKSYQGREWRQHISSSGVSEVYTFLKRNLNMKRYFRVYVWKYPIFEGGNLEYRLQAHIIVLRITLCIILNILLIYFLKVDHSYFKEVSWVLNWHLVLPSYDLIKLLFLVCLKSYFLTSQHQWVKRHLVYYFICFFMLKYKTSLASLL